jgi:hypothetical protein
MNAKYTGENYFTELSMLKDIAGHWVSIHAAIAMGFIKTLNSQYLHTHTVSYI